MRAHNLNTVRTFLLIETGRMVVETYRRKDFVIGSMYFHALHIMRMYAYKVTVELGAPLLRTMPSAQFVGGARLDVPRNRTRRRRRQSMTLFGNGDEDGSERLSRMTLSFHKYSL